MKTFIFGAGASIPFFNPILSTSYITSKVCDVTEWMRVMDKYRQNNGQNRMIIHHDAVVLLINKILEIKPNANFEEIAEIIDKVCSYGFDFAPDNNMMNLLLLIMENGFNPQNPRPFGPEWSDVPFLLREIIAEAILDLQNNHKHVDYQHLLNLQHNLIETVCTNDNEVSVMSLCYDDCVYDSLFGLGFENGFRPKNDNYMLQMDVEKFMHAFKAVYFPHGHLKFHFTDNDNVTFWHDSNNANDERWSGLNGVAVGSTLTVLSGKFAYNYNTFLSTGQTKDDGFNHLPYAIYYQRLAIDLFKSDIVYVIGYSFGDLHINRLLRSFLKLNPNNKLFVIDYYPYPITMVDEYQDPQNIITKIHDNFKTDWNLIVDGNGNRAPVNNADIDVLNNQGYGNLFDQVIFYKKGYADFLNEFGNVI